MNYDPYVFSPADNRPVNFNVQDDGDIALLIKYTGAQESATVEIDANGDLLFKVGALTAEAADTNIQVGATAGTIDVSNAAADTLGEVVDAINGADDWSAVIVDGYRSSSCGTTQKLLLKTATQAKVPEGIKANWDSTAKLSTVQLIAPKVIREDIRVYEYGGNKVNPALPFAGMAAELASVYWKSTYATGSSSLSLIEADSDGDNAVAFYTLASGATTVAAEGDFKNYPVRSARGKKLFVQLTNTTALSVVTLQGFGRFVRVGQ